MKYSQQVNMIKGLAILSVIILHTLSTKNLMNIGAPFHIWQAVPVFIILAGFTGANSLKRCNTIAESYSLVVLGRRFKRILVPFVFIWVIQLLITIYLQRQSPGIFRSFYQGGISGYGSYFIPVIIQHIFILPLLYWLAIRNMTAMLMAAFFISIVAEYILKISDVTVQNYKILYARYFFASALGVWLAIQPPRIVNLVVLSCISFIYIVLVNYFGLQLTFIINSWLSQHAPSYFYPLLLIILLFHLPANKILIQLGKASYHIFLFQMNYFWLRAYFPHSLIFNLVFCIFGGYLFFKIKSVKKNIKF